MYVYKDPVNKIDVVWEPEEVQVGFDIVKEVTGKTGTKENPVEVTGEQREEINQIYNDRFPQVDKPVVPEASKVELLEKQVESLAREKEATESILQELILKVYA